MRRGDIGRWIAFVAVVIRLFFASQFPDTIHGKTRWRILCFCVNIERALVLSGLLGFVFPTSGFCISLLVSTCRM